MNNYIKLIQQQKRKELKQKNKIKAFNINMNEGISTKSSYSAEHAKGFKKTTIEPIRNKLGQYVMSLNSNPKTDDSTVMRVKGKILNSFLGILKTDLNALKIEAFPEEVNNHLLPLILLKKCDIIWIDL